MKRTVKGGWHNVSDTPVAFKQAQLFFTVPLVRFFTTPDPLVFLVPNLHSVSTYSASLMLVYVNAASKVIQSVYFYIEEGYNFKCLVHHIYCTVVVFCLFSDPIHILIKTYSMYYVVQSTITTNCFVLLLAFSIR